MAISKLTPSIKYELLTNSQQNQIPKRKVLGKMKMAFPLILTRKNIIKPQVSSTAPNHSSTTTFRIQQILNLQQRLLKKLFLQRYSEEMSFQFTMDTNTRPLVCLSYHSSDEDMEVDVMSVTDGLDYHD